MLQVSFFFFFSTNKDASSFSAINLCLVINVLDNKTIILPTASSAKYQAIFARFRRVIVKYPLLLVSCQFSSLTGSTVKTRAWKSCTREEHARTARAFPYPMSEIGNEVGVK